MTSNFSISIAMCTYNGSQYLTEQLESIEKQTFVPTELVVCDDGSTDDTLILLENFSKHAKFPVHIHRNDRNLGSTKNFEKAICCCSGDIIALTDQDDVWLPTKLERLAQAFSTSPQVGVVFTDAVLVDSSLQPLNLKLWKSVRFTQFQQRNMRKGNATKVLLKHNVVTGATMAFRTKYRNFILPIPEIWSHDAWIALLVSFIADVQTISEPQILYRQHSGNLIGATALKTKKDRWKGRSFAERCQKRIKKFECVITQISESAAWTDLNLQIMDELEAKLRHLKARYQMSISEWKRVPLATREFILLRYHRFSERDRAFFSDIFRSRKK